MFFSKKAKPVKQPIPSLSMFAELGSAVSDNPEAKKVLRAKLIEMNGGDPNIDAKKLATKIIVDARSKGVRRFMPRPVVQKVIENILADDDTPIDSNGTDGESNGDSGNKD